MARLYDKAFFGDALVPLEEASVSVASSAVLYGLSVYTVLPVCTTSGGMAAFRVDDHYRRLVNSSRIVGIDSFEKEWTKERFVEMLQTLVQANHPEEDVLVRITVHVTELLPGTRSRGLPTTVSGFMSHAASILPAQGARLKTSSWRRTPDASIPSRAKVNGAYINSVLGKQDAIDSGYDDCLFLNAAGKVCELSAANIFIVRDERLITPDISSDILEGITRKTVLELARSMHIECSERPLDLTEMYIADEAFACGTSAYITPILMLDARPIGNGAAGPLTQQLKKHHADLLHGKGETNLLTAL